MHCLCDDEERGQEVDDFVRLYRVEYPGAVRLAFALTADAQAAEDIVQEAFLRTHDRIAMLESPGGYLRVTVVNLCHDEHRRRGREQRFRTLMPVRNNVALDARELLDVLARLPYRQQAVLILRYWSDWSEAEIAQALGCRPGAVKSLASRGLARLKKELPQ